MKKILFFLILTLIACENKKNKNQEIKIQNENSIEDNQFLNKLIQHSLYSELNSIEKENFFINIDERDINNKNVIQKSDLNKLLAGHELWFDYELSKPIIYSVTKQSKYYSVCIYGMVDDWYYGLYMFNFDYKNKYIDHECFYSHGGDGGYYIESDLTRKTNNDYILTILDCESYFDDSDTNNIQKRTSVDSSVYELKINEFGKIKKIKKTNKLYSK